ncbi:MAG: prepilin-type N-terminal cleavage/methylation domain-containing protein [Planctomycetota bacterium]
MKRSEIKTKIRRGFSLIELVVVVVILGLVAAIAIPRTSRGAAGAAESAQAADIATLRNAIEMYKTEHGGTLPAAATFEAQLTQYTNDAGGTSATPSGTHIYGPYLSAIPPQKIGSRKGENGVATADAATVGWIYNETTGVITVNDP